MRSHRQVGGLTAAAFVASLVLHAAVGAVVARASRFVADTEAKPPEVIELAVVQPPALPPPVELPPESELPAEPAPPVPIVKRAPKQKAPPLQTAPPPSSTPAEPESPPPEPAVGVTSESVVDAPSAVAVPLGNTLAGAPTGRTPTAPAAYAGGVVGGSGSTPFAPVAEGFVKQWPRTLSEVRVPLPEEARRLQMSGTVKLRVGIDEAGKVREVRVIKGAGFGMDEAASQAMWRFKFTPAIGQNGQPVPFRIHYDYIFASGR